MKISKKILIKILNEEVNKVTYKYSESGLALQSWVSVVNHEINLSRGEILIKEEIRNTLQEFLGEVQSPMVPSTQGQEDKRAVVQETLMKYNPRERQKWLISKKNLEDQDNGYWKDIVVRAFPLKDGTTLEMAQNGQMPRPKVPRISEA